jgi:hypothetical protein
MQQNGEGVQQQGRRDEIEGNKERLRRKKENRKQGGNGVGGEETVLGGLTYSTCLPSCSEREEPCAAEQED